MHSKQAIFRWLQKENINVLLSAVWCILECVRTVVVEKYLIRVVRTPSGFRGASGVLVVFVMQSLLFGGNQYHWLSRWFVFCPIRDRFRYWSLKIHRKIRQPQRQLLLSPLGLFLFAFVYWLTRKRVNILLQSHLIIFQIFLQLIPNILFNLFCIFLLYLHSILCTKSVYFHTYICD